MEFLTLEELSLRFPIEDVKSQYLSLLSFLSETPMISNDEFKTHMNKITRMGVVWVCIKNQDEKNQDEKNQDEKTETNFQIIGTGTLLFEPKLSHGCKYVGHIEDIVVHPDFRCLNIASTILDKLKEFAQPYCYKVILECKEELKDFYEKNGFVSSKLLVMKI
jgi:ribosomal protein S18 acetylase RimI-like enzyme